MLAAPRAGQHWGDFVGKVAPRSVSFAFSTTSF